MHYALDMWLTREHPDVVFERYADDVVVHCASHARAVQVLAGITERMNGLSLAPNPARTQIVYRQDNNRRQRFPLVAFTFLGYTLSSARGTRSSRSNLLCVPARDQPARPEEDQHAGPPLAPAPQDLQHPERTRPHDQPDRRGLDAVLRQVLPAFYPSALYPLLARINAYLVRWIRNTYRRYDRTRAARRKLRDLATAYPHGFRHSQWVTTAW